MPNLIDIQNKDLKPYLNEFSALIKESKEILGELEVNRTHRDLFSKLEECLRGEIYPKDELLDDLAIALTNVIDISPWKETNYNAAYVARYIILDWVEKSGVGEIDAYVCHDIFQIDHDDEKLISDLVSKVRLKYIED